MTHKKLQAFAIGGDATGDVLVKFDTEAEQGVSYTMRPQLARDLARQLIRAADYLESGEVLSV